MPLVIRRSSFYFQIKTGKNESVIEVTVFRRLGEERCDDESQQCREHAGNALC